VLGTPVRLNRITVPTFVVGAITDHLTPWKGCYRTTRLLGGDATFVLTWSGHVASLVNPPDNPKAHYWTGGAPGPDPDAWFATATKHQGSWWEVWADWVTRNAGVRRPARNAWAATNIRSLTRRQDGMYAMLPLTDLDPKRESHPARRSQRLPGMLAPSDQPCGSSATRVSRGDGRSPSIPDGAHSAALTACAASITCGASSRSLLRGQRDVAIIGNILATRRT